MNSICNFIPAKGKDDLKVVHFVYETEFQKLRQPFVHSIYYMHLVVRGEGKLKLLSREYPLGVGTLFFSFPGVPFEIEGSSDLTYTYLSFMGLRAQELLRDLGVDTVHPVRYGFEDEIGFWKTSIRRIDRQNAGILSESVLLYTLSFLQGEGEDAKKDPDYGVIEGVVDYIDNNYTDPDLSLKKVADIFAYTDKYLSHLFKTQMQINFNKYLTRLRVQRAIERMSNGKRDVSEIAAECGFRESGYFSKVFKRMMGKTPLEYIGSLHASTDG